MTPLLDWISRPCGERGIHFAQGQDEWEYWSYPRLAVAALRTAGSLARNGVAPGDNVLLVHPNGPGFVAAFFGALALGATPSPVAVPAAFGNKESYVDHLVRAAELSSSRVIVTSPELTDELSHHARAAGCQLFVPDLEDSPADPMTPQFPEIALVQFSSGTTGSPKGIRLTYSALESNVLSILRWLGTGPEDSLATWLPLHHDMGLVGCLLAPVAAQVDVWMMRPDHFVRDPGRWLRTIGRQGVTIAVSPNFALDLVVRRVKPRMVTGLDLTRWRALVVGSERIQPATVRKFLELVTPLGFASGSFLPAYGLAEASLAVTGTGPGRSFSTVHPDWDSMRTGQPVTLLEDAADEQGLVGAGRPLPGMGVTIIGTDAEPLPEGTLGEIAVTGNSVTRSLLTKEGLVTWEPDEALHTGDAGFLLNGELFVIGRLGDGVKLRGTWVFAEPLEELVKKHAARPHHTTVLLGHLSGEPVAAVAVENGRPQELAALGHRLSEAVPGLRVLACAVRAGWIRRTTSGKPRRSQMWQELTTLVPSGFVSWDSRTAALVAAADEAQ
ncbi:AMP-binding protein [Streptomyces sp. CL12]|uniref:AMP-binding protein n=1 Tax=Streptomyces sp. CL12 TaxID=3391744 RepID=UPI003A7FEA48